MSQIYEFRCPKCGGTELCILDVKISCKLEQEPDGNFQTIEKDFGGHSWDDDSLMMCDNNACNHWGKVKTFRVKQP